MPAMNSRVGVPQMMAREVGSTSNWIRFVTTDDIRISYENRSLFIDPWNSPGFNVVTGRDTFIEFTLIEERDAYAFFRNMMARNAQFELHMLMPADNRGNQEIREYTCRMVDLGMAMSEHWSKTGVTRINIKLHAVEAQGDAVPMPTLRTDLEREPTFIEMTADECWYLAGDLG